MRQSDSRDYDDWMERAYEDVLCARLLAQKEDCLNGAAFHAQQAVEKSLKAYILFKSRSLVDGHNLVWLCKKAAGWDAGLRDWLGSCITLNRFYIEARYPADISIELEPAQAQGFADLAEKLFDYVGQAIDPAGN
ncbi:HEPN domain-containing protein [Oscillospiraceae bacterium MB08-C2-2]|nr:HEPN domain-containing protein [Oscillospiraceae bacterium MB08-C2-2]